MLLLGFWFLTQLYFGAAGLASPVGGGEGVAYFAHIGGFAFGLLVIRLLIGRRGPEPPLPVY
jgi:membrane associated rhomboid family serine protease